MIMRIFIVLLALLSINATNQSVKLANELKIVEISGDKIPDVFTRLKMIKAATKDVADIVSNFNAIIAGLKKTFKLFTESGEPELSIQLKKTHDQVIGTLSAVSNQIDELSHTVTQGFNLAIKEMIDNMENTVDFSRSSHYLSIALETINRQYTKSVDLYAFSNETGVNQQTQEFFVQQVFLLNDNVPDILKDIHALLFKPTSALVSRSFFDVYKTYHKVNIC